MEALLLRDFCQTDPSSDAKAWKTELEVPPSAQDLQLPIDPEFLSLPPKLSPQVMLRRIAETMPWRSTRPGEAQRRLEMKVDVEFVL